MDTDGYISKYIKNSIIIAKDIFFKHNHDKEEEIKKIINYDYNIRIKMNNTLYDKKYCSTTINEIICNGISFFKIGPNYFSDKIINSYSNKEHLQNNNFNHFFKVPIKNLFFIPGIRDVAEKENKSLESEINNSLSQKKIPFSFIPDKDIDDPVRMEEIFKKDELVRTYFLNTSQNNKRKQYSFIEYLNSQTNSKLYIPSFRIKQEIFHAVPVTKNKKFNFIHSANLEEAKIIILTDCISLALKNQKWLRNFNKKDIAWGSYSETWNPIELCDFEILKDKTVYYLVINHSSWKINKIIKNAKIIADLFYQNSISFKFICLLHPNKNIKLSNSLFNQPPSLIQDYNTFLNSNGYSQRVPLDYDYYEKYFCNKSLISPYITLKSTTIILGNLGTGKTLISMLLGMSLLNGMNPFNGWKTLQQVNDVLYVNCSNLEVKEKINEAFIYSVLQKKVPTQFKRFNFFNYNNDLELESFLRSYHCDSDKLIILDGYKNDERLLKKLKNSNWTIIAIRNRAPLCKESFTGDVGEIFKLCGIKNTRTLKDVHEEYYDFDSVIYLSALKKQDNQFRMKVNILSNIAKQSSFYCNINFKAKTFARERSNKEKQSRAKPLTQDDKIKIIDKLDAMSVDQYGQRVKLPPEDKLIEKIDKMFDIKLKSSMIKKLKREANVSKKRNNNQGGF